MTVCSQILLSSLSRIEDCKYVQIACKLRATLTRIQVEMYTRVQLNPIYEREWKGCCWRIFDQIKETTNHASGEISVEDFFKLYLEKVFPLNL